MVDKTPTEILQEQLDELRKKLEEVTGAPVGKPPVHPEYKQLVLHDQPGHTWRRHYNPEGWIEDTFDDAVCYPAVVCYIFPQVEAPGQKAGLFVMDYLGRPFSGIFERDYAPRIKREQAEGGTDEGKPYDHTAFGMSRVMAGDIVAYDPMTGKWYAPRQEAFE